MFNRSLAIVFVASLLPLLSSGGQSLEEKGRRSFAIEADAIAYGISGYSGIATVSLSNGLQFAIGSGRYEVPGFLLSEDANYDQAQWKATSTSIQVVRAMYRFNGPMKNGPTLGAIVLHQNWRLRSDVLAGETKFRPVSVGVTSGYYLHVGKHFYLYPTAAFTYNTVVAGTAGVNGTPYHVAKFGPNASLHAGWEWSR